MSNTWRNYIKIDQLPGDYQLIVQTIGLDNAIKLSESLAKVPIYLVSPDKLFLPAKKKYILERYTHANPENPFNHKLIALETGLSIRAVYDIIASQKAESNQQKLFGDDDDD